MAGGGLPFIFLPTGGWQLDEKNEEEKGNLYRTPPIKIKYLGTRKM